MLSRARTGLPQAKQCEGGLTTDMPRGMRAMQTLRKLPQVAPNTTAMARAKLAKTAGLSMGLPGKP